MVVNRNSKTSLRKSNMSDYTSLSKIFHKKGGGCGTVERTVSANARCSGSNPVTGNFINQI